MQMTRLGYFAEFLVLPACLIAFAIYADAYAEPISLTRWGILFLTGAIVWTLLEYLLHRFVFHHAPVISDLHGHHHERPLDLIGVPAWISVSSGVIAVLCPLWVALGANHAIALTSGIAAGYLWYVLIHYATHYVQPRRGSYLARARVHHMRHHYAPDDGNFGVTTEFWDRVFGTALDQRARPALYRWITHYWPGAGPEA